MVFVLLGCRLPPREPSVDIVLVLINDSLVDMWEDEDRAMRETTN